MTKQRRKISLRSSSPALTIVLLFGVISMLGDLVHESARSVNGQYLSLVGLSATQVGLVFGLGEFLGYALRLLSGAWLDKSKRYWLFLFIGYGVHLVIPLMGLTTSWGWLYDLEQQPIIVAMTILSEGAAVALYVVLYKRIQRERLSN